MRRWKSSCARVRPSTSGATTATSIPRARRCRRADLRRRRAKRRGHPSLSRLAAHFIGLNFGGIRVAYECPGTASIYSRQKNPVLDRIFLRARTRFGDPVLVSRQEGLRAVVRVIRAGHPFYFLPDMDFGARDSIFVPFFGVPTATITAMPRLAQLTGARILPVTTRQVGDGYEVRFHPPWDDYPTGDVAADVRRMNAFIEERVLEMPEQYFWAHKRFKTRPPGEPSPYEKKARGRSRESGGP